MKPITRHCLIALVFLAMQTNSYGQSVAINDDGSLPHSSAILDLKVAAAAKKGALLPRMTAPQRAAIVNPAKGLLVYDSTSNSFWFHNGTAWTEISKGINPWTVNGTNVYNLPANIGIGVSTPKAKLNVVQNGNVLFGSSMSGIGKKLFWNGAKAALRAGEISGEYPDDTPPYAWDDVNIGINSFAVGSSTIATGNSSAAFGGGTSATGGAAVAFGQWTASRGWASAAFGLGTGANGDQSFAAGYALESDGNTSATFNSDNRSSGEGSFTAGELNTTNGNYSVTFGKGNEVNADHCMTIGEYSNALAAVSGATAPLFVIGNGIDGAPKNALVALRNGIISINKNPGIAAVNDGLLQLKQSGTRHLLTLEASTTVNKWSFSLTPNLVLYYNNALRGTFNSTTGAYVAASDSRLKKDINELSPVLSNVMQLKTYTYHLLDNEIGDPYSYGLMAQELENIFPDMVTKIEPAKETSLLGINYTNLGVIAIKAIQEQQQFIEIQNKRITELETTVDDLKRLINEFIKLNQKENQ